MSNLLVKDGTGSAKYLKTTGEGTIGDPHVPQQVVEVSNAELDINVTNQSLDVNVQDRTTRPVILPMVRILGSLSLTVSPVKNSYTISVVSSVGATIGNHIRIVDEISNRYYFGRILNIIGGSITVDSPIDFQYLVSSEVTYSDQNLAKDGSVTPLHYHLRTGVPSIPSTIHINRIIMMCECTGAVSLALFGDLTALARGIVFRSLAPDGEVHNIFNAKKVADLVGISYDVTIYQATNPAQGRNGFAMRLSFNGDDKMGTALAIAASGNLGVIVQDDLSGLIELRVVLEGHVEII